MTVAYIGASVVINVTYANFYFLILVKKKKIVCLHINIVRRN